MRTISQHQVDETPAITTETDEQRTVRIPGSTEHAGHHLITVTLGNQAQDQTLEGLKTGKCSLGSAIQRSQHQHLAGQAKLPTGHFEQIHGVSPPQQ